MVEYSPTGNSRFHRIVKPSHKEPQITESDSRCSLSASYQDCTISLLSLANVVFVTTITDGCPCTTLK